MAKHRAPAPEETTTSIAARLAVGLLLGVVVSLVVALVAVPRLIGADTYVVTSGSMEPALRVGSVIVVEPIETDDVRTGDVVTFRLPTGDVTTHRVVDIDRIGLTTKGDANEDIDPWIVTGDELLGRVRYTVPFVGYLRHPGLEPSGALFTDTVFGTGGVVEADLPAPVARAATVEPPATAEVATTTTTIPDSTTTTSTVPKSTTTTVPETSTTIPESTTTTSTVPDPTPTTSSVPESTTSTSTTTTVPGEATGTP